MNTNNKTTGISIIDRVKEGAKAIVEKVKTVIGYASPTLKGLGADIIQYVQPIDFNAQVDSPKGATPIEIVVICIDELCKIAEQYNRSIRIERGRIYIYNGAYWQLMDEGETKNFLGKVAEKMGVDKYKARYHAIIDKLYKQLLCAAYAPDFEPDKSKVLINVLNGTLHITSEGVSLQKHNPEDNLRYVIQYIYQEDAECPIMQRFLDRVMPDRECQRLLLDTLGYTFMPGLKLEEMLLLEGQGQDGKSVIADCIIHLLGSKNVSGYSLNDITKDLKYCRVDFVTKLLNYGSDINMKGIDEAEFKKLTSRESILCRAIYGQGFETSNIPPIIFNTNTIPTASIGNEKSVFRRINIIPMRNPILDEEVDKNFAKGIYENANEMRGFLKLVVDGAIRVQKLQRLSPCKASEDYKKELLQECDSLGSFLDSLGYIPGFGHTIKRTDLLDMYRTFCKKNGYDASMGNIQFTRSLKAKGFEVRKGQSGAGPLEVHFACRNDDSETQEVTDTISEPDGQP